MAVDPVQRYQIVAGDTGSMTIENRRRNNETSKNNDAKMTNWGPRRGMQFAYISRIRPEYSDQIQNAGQIKTDRARAEGTSTMSVGRYMSKLELEFGEPEDDGDIELNDGAK